MGLYIVYVKMWDSVNYKSISAKKMNKKLLDCAHKHAKSSAYGDDFVDALELTPRYWEIRSSLPFSCNIILAKEASKICQAEDCVLEAMLYSDYDTFNGYEYIGYSYNLFEHHLITATEAEMIDFHGSPAC